MKEVEVKVRLRNRKKVIKALKALGCRLSKPVTQEDTTYFPSKIGPKEDFHLEDIAFRIRIEGRKKILTLKQPQKNFHDCYEREICFDDPKQMDDILKKIGYWKVVEMKKTRIKTKYKDIEICLDYVEELGDFIEAEKKVLLGDSEKIQEELLTFLETLGVKREDQSPSGYDRLIRKKRGLL